MCEVDLLNDGHAGTSFRVLLPPWGTRVTGYQPRWGASHYGEWGTSHDGLLVVGGECQTMHSHMYSPLNGGELS